MWSTVELREIRVFLTLADELHFARSAARLHLSPSRVSQIIRELEVKLGVVLFERTSRRVSLTTDGVRLRDELAPGFESVSQALERARVSSDAVRATLRVGELCGAGGPRFVEVIKAFEARHPSCDVTVQEVPWTDVLGPLTRREVDVLATWLPIDRPDVDVGPILGSERRVLAVAPDHPLAARRSVTVEDIADHRVARIDSLPRELVTGLIPLTTPNGRPIHRTPDELRSLSEISVQVALGRIVHPTVPSFGRAANAELTYVPILGMPPSRTGLVWRRGNHDPRVHEFAHLVEAVLGNGRHAPTTLTTTGRDRTVP